ncbi:MAG: DedA family protein [Planctomycetota bacterium]|nr:DedA family protein [Planctomycetota bacterium]
MHHLPLFSLLDFEHVRSCLEWGGYIMLFGILLACGLGLPVPEDIPLVAAGFLISQHHMNVFIAAPLAWLGIIGGDSMLYRLGWRYGHNITRVPLVGRHITMERIEHAERLFNKYGVLVVAVGRLFAGIRGGMVVAAGATRFKFPKFILVDSIAAIFSGGLFMFLGYWFGSNLDTMNRKLHEFKLALTLVGIAIAILFGIYIYFRSRKSRSIGDVIVGVPPAPKPQPANGEQNHNGESTSTADFHSSPSVSRSE